MKIGLFFGSFNPIHTGHLIIANHILNETALDKIWFVVSPMNPFKVHSDLLDENQRLSLVDLAIRADERLFGSDIEFQLPRPSFTINTLSHLKRTKSGHDFSIIMGSDNFKDLGKWKNFAEIVANYRILIYLRKGFDVRNEWNASIDLLNAPILDISSSEIREIIKKGKSIRYLVPEAVCKEIDERGYYRK